MKTFKLIIISLIISLKLIAQPANIKYDTCHYLSQYAGEWVYATNSDTIKIYLRFKRNFSANAGYVCDNLYGWHEYRHNGVIVESDYANRFMDLPYNYDSIIPNRPKIALLNYDCILANSNKFEGSIRDISQADERHEVKAEVITGAGGEQYMLWKQNFIEFHGAWTGAYGMTLPRQFTLIKQ